MLPNRRHRIGGRSARCLSMRRRVGASGDTLDGRFPPKPPKMRWGTYKRLRAVDAGAMRLPGCSAPKTAIWRPAQFVVLGPSTAAPYCYRKL
jgi:hypothetical protein